MTTARNKKIIWFIIISSVAVIIALSAGFYVYIREQNQKSETLLNNTYNNGRAAQRAGDYENAIVELLPVASQKNYEIIAIQAELAIAWNKFSRNIAGDRAEAVATFKKIAENESLPPYIRAYAYNSLALVFILTRDYNLMRTEVFKDRPYESYFNFVQAGNYFLAIRQFALRADSFYPNAMSKSIVALSYASPLVIDGVTPPGKDNRETAELVFKYLRDAKPLMKEITEPVFLGNAWLNYASAISMANEVLRDMPLSEITAVYENVFLIEKTSNPDVYFGSLDLTTRVYYAMALYYNASDPKKYSDKIHDLLLLFSGVNKTNPKYFASREFFKNIMIGEYQGHLLQERFRVLASISPEFKSFIESVSR